MNGAALVTVAVDGVPLDGAAGASVTAVEVVGTIDRPAQCRVSAVTDPWQPAWTPPPGARLTLRVRDGEVPLFDGTVNGIERSWSQERVAMLVVRAHDALARLRTAPRTEATGGDVVAVARAIAGRHGLQLQTHASAPPSPVVGQYGETDLAFLRRLASRVGLHLAVRGQVLHLFDAGGIGDPLVLRLDHELRSLTVDVRTDVDAEDVAVQGWDPGTGQAHAAGAGALRPGWLLDGAAATALRRALVARRRRVAEVATAVADGDPRLRPGTRVRVGPAGHPGEPLLVSRVRHVVDAAGGYRTELATDPVDPEPGREPAAWTLGVVVAVDDPEGRGRVRVSLGAYGDQASDWLSVVLPGAGPGKGLVALPDVGDRVVVLGQADDPGRGVVLGGLVGVDAVPGDPVVAGRTRRTLLRLPGGGQVAIDDEARTVLVDDGRGSRLELGPERVVLHAATDLDLAAPGRRIRLLADAIDLERA